MVDTTTNCKRECANTCIFSRLEPYGTWESSFAGYMHLVACYQHSKSDDIINDVTDVSGDTKVSVLGEVAGYQVRSVLMSVV